MPQLKSEEQLALVETGKSKIKKLIKRIIRIA